MLIFNDMTRDQQGSLSIDICDYNSVANFLLEWLEQHIDSTRVKAIGHRVAHAGSFSPFNISFFGQNESIIQLHS